MIQKYFFSQCKLVKGLIMVERELRQQHQSDLLSQGPGRPESAARETPPPDNKSRVYRCRNSLPTVINSNNNMTQQLCMKRIYAKIHEKSQPSRVPSSTCLHCDVTQLALTTEIVDLNILSWRVREREERRQVRKTMWPVKEECFVAIEIVYTKSITINILDIIFGSLSRRFKLDPN